MKHEFHCTWGIVSLFVDNASWNIQYSGDIPANIKKTIENVRKASPRPDAVMAHFMLKQACKNTLMYIK